MSDYISRQVAMDAIHNHYEVRNPEQNALMDEVSMLIFRLPAADVRPVVRGKWIRHYAPIGKNKTTPYGWNCSLCGEWEPIRKPFCTCGAVMGGDAE